MKRRERVLPAAHPRRVLHRRRRAQQHSLMTSDPVSFPGFRLSIEDALDAGQVPCGVVTAHGARRSGRIPSAASASWSRTSASRPARSTWLPARSSASSWCAARRRRLPVFCFVTSGGMQTKEGAGALFSMAVVNDRITRFVRDHDLPIVMFGFGDCTGRRPGQHGHSSRWSRTTISPAPTCRSPARSSPSPILPLTSTLSNYLSEIPGAMDGSGAPSHSRLGPGRAPLRDRPRDSRCRSSRSAQVIERVLEGKAVAEERRSTAPRRRAGRSATAPRPSVRSGEGAGARPRLYRREARQRRSVDAGIDVVLVQSDPDMDSTAARSLRGDSALVCLGGSTPDESYLNAHSVIRIAESEGVDALHPGIGFLSESASFADLCARHDLNFVGPSGRGDGVDGQQVERRADGDPSGDSRSCPAATVW